jgi:hypothetical protein
MGASARAAQGWPRLRGYYEPLLLSGYVREGAQNYRSGL